jgi:hypothetical protein
MKSLVRVLNEIGKAILFVCAVALPAIAAWGLFFVMVYHAKLWLVGLFWYLGIGALASSFLCWRSPEPRRTLSGLVLQSLALFAFMVTITLFRRGTTP